MSDIKSQVKPHSLDAHFYTLKGFFFFWMPLMVPYGKLAPKAKEAGYTPKAPIIEEGVKFGNGTVGIVVENPKEGDINIKHYKGEYLSYAHYGSYRTLGKSFQAIMKSYPSSHSFLSLYTNAPGDVEEKDLETIILFKEK
jgi:hypothetical protein